MKMKRLILILMFSIIIIFNDAEAETVIKVGTSIVHWKVEQYKFTALSGILQVEQSIYREFSIGFGLRKEGTWGYDGYYVSLYPIYKIWLSKKKKIFWNIGAGLEYGLASNKYNKYRTINDQNGNLIFHKWVYLVQNAPVPCQLKKGNIGVIYPFLSFSFLGIDLGSGFSFEIGSKIQLLRFGIKSCEFDFDPETSLTLTYNVQDKKVWMVVPTFFVQIGISFGNKKQKGTEIPIPF